jgi:hypothetical protein
MLVTENGGEGMRRVVYASVKQAISGKGFCLGVLGVVLIIFASSVQDIVIAFRAKELLSYGFHHTLLINALTSDAMTLVLPIFAALPFTSSFVDDVKSGFIKEYLPRISILKYLVGRCSACVISGGLVFVCGILIAYMIAALIFTPMEVAPVLVPAGGALALSHGTVRDHGIILLLRCLLVCNRSALSHLDIQQIYGLCISFCILLCVDHTV